MLIFFLFSGRLTNSYGNAEYLTEPKLAINIKHDYFGKMI